MDSWEEVALEALGGREVSGATVEAACGIRQRVTSEGLSGFHISIND